MSIRRLSTPAALLTLGALVPAPLAAQSLFATRGLGVPAPAVDARAATLGGIGVGLIGFNTSLVNPAEPAGITRRGVAAALQPVSSTANVDGAEDGTSGARFPLMSVIYPFSDRLVGMAGFGSYLDQSWAIQSRSTVSVGDRTVDVSDLIRSSGGVAQLRVGVAYSLSPTFALGLAGGVLTGNVERTISRLYADTVGELRPFQDQLRWSYLAPMMSAGFRWDIAGRLRLAGSVLAATDLEASGVAGEAADRTYTAPLEVTGAASARLTPLLMATGGAVWSRAPQTGAETVSRETMRIGGGLEYQGLRSGGRTYPIRLGARWSQLPYHLEGESAPTEQALALGIGFRIGDPTDPAALADIGVERGSRSGLAGGAVSGGVEERLWRFTFSLSLFGR